MQVGLEKELALAAVSGELFFQAFYLHLQGSHLLITFGGGIKLLL